MQNKRKTLIVFIGLFFGISAHAWDRVKECDNEALIIERNQAQAYRLTMQGNAVNYFIEQGAIPKELVTNKQEFISELILYNGHLRSIVRLSDKEQAFFDLYDYGHTTLIATRDSLSKTPGQEIAAWNYRYCRAFEN